MAVNEKVVYATTWTSHGKHLFKPGEQMTGRVEPYVLRSAMEGGLASDSHAEAERARKGEQERQTIVNHQIQNRSEKRNRENAGR